MTKKEIVKRVAKRTIPWFVAFTTGAIVFANREPSVWPVAAIIVGSYLHSFLLDMWFDLK